MPSLTSSSSPPFGHDFSFFSVPFLAAAKSASALEADHASSASATIPLVNHFCHYGARERSARAGKCRSAAMTHATPEQEARHCDTDKKREINRKTATKTRQVYHLADGHRHTTYRQVGRQRKTILITRTRPSNYEALLRGEDHWRISGERVFRVICILRCVSTPLVITLVALHGDRSQQRSPAQRGGQRCVYLLTPCMPHY